MEEYEDIQLKKENIFVHVNYTNHDLCYVAIYAKHGKNLFIEWHIKLDKAFY